VAAPTPRDGHIDLFVTDAAGIVWSTWWEDAAGWQPWFQIPGHAMAAGAGVTAISPTDGHIDLFATDGGGQVWSTWWESGPGWQNWFPISAGVPMQPGAGITVLVHYPAGIPIHGLQLNQEIQFAA
jgi:hypothetical protein